jgi:hypothetical protein
VSKKLKNELLTDITFFWSTLVLTDCLFHGQNRILRALTAFTVGYLSAYLCNSLLSLLTNTGHVPPIESACKKDTCDVCPQPTHWAWGNSSFMPSLNFHSPLTDPPPHPARRGRATDLIRGAVVPTRELISTSSPIIKSFEVCCVGL